MVIRLIGEEVLLKDALDVQRLIMILVRSPDQRPIEGLLRPPGFQDGSRCFMPLDTKDPPRDKVVLESMSSPERVSLRERVSGEGLADEER